MAYVPIAPEDFVPPFDALGDPYAQTWKNHGEMITAYEQTLATSGQATTTSGATALAFRFKARGGAGLGDITVTMRADPNGSAFDLELEDGGATVLGTTAVSGAAMATFTVSVTPTVADTDYVVRVMRTSGATNLEIAGWVAVSEAPATITDVPNLTPEAPANYWQSSTFPVATEHIQRMLDGPGALLVDRPHCLFSHIAPDTALATVKATPDFEYWGMAAATVTANQYTLAGFGGFGIDDPRPRTLTIDAYVAADDVATALAELRIGAWSWSPTPGSWQRTTIMLSPGWHDVVATVSSDDTEACVWQSLQIWRS
jgi:hypothetical protein